MRWSNHISVPPLLLTKFTGSNFFKKMGLGWKKMRKFSLFSAEKYKFRKVKNKMVETKQSNWNFDNSLIIEFKYMERSGKSHFLDVERGNMIEVKCM